MKIRITEILQRNQARLAWWLCSLMNSCLAFDYGQRARDFCNNYQPMLCNRTELEKVSSFAFSAIYAGSNNFKQLLINVYLFPWNVCLVMIIKYLRKMKRRERILLGLIGLNHKHTVFIWCGHKSQCHLVCHISTAKISICRNNSDALKWTASFAPTINLIFIKLDLVRNLMIF